MEKEPTKPFDLYEEAYWDSYLDDPEAMRQDPNHVCSFDTTAGDIDYAGEPDYCWGVVFECACGRTQIIPSEELDEELSVAQDHAEDER